MKTTKEITHAISMLRNILKTANLHPMQVDLISGIILGLAWAKETPGCTMIDRVLAGEPLRETKRSKGYSDE